MQILSSSAVNTCRYSDGMLKYKPKEDLKTFEKTLPFSREQPLLFRNLERGSHNSGAATQITDANLSDSITNSLQPSLTKIYVELF